MKEISSGARLAIKPMDWIGLILISFLLPAVLTWAIGAVCQKMGLFAQEDL